MYPDEHGQVIRTDADRHPDPRERAEIERRQVIDDRFIDLEEKLEALDQKIGENTEITTQVRDILTSFKVIGMFAKWLGGIAAAGVAMYHAWQKATGR